MLKKLFTFVCAIAIALCAGAAPIAPKAELAKKAPVAIKQMQKVQFEKAQIANFNQLSATPALKVTNQKATVVPAIRGKKVSKADHRAVPSVAAVRKAANAVAGTYDVTIADFGAEDYETDYYFELYAENGDVFIFDIYYTGSFEFGKTYTLADMETYYSYMYIAATADYADYTTASFNITVDQDNLTHIVASATLENGDTYNLTFDETAWAPTGVTIDVVATNYKAEYSSRYDEYVYTASNSDYSTIAIWVYTETELGTFNEEVDIEGSYLQLPNSQYVIFHSVATPIVVAQDEQGNKSLTGALYGEDGNIYALNLTYEKPATKEITLVADTLNFNTSRLTTGYYTVDGYNTDSTYAFFFYFISKGITGDFTEENLYAYQTWVDEKNGKKTVVSYQNLSAANIQVSLVNDTLHYVGTITLATNGGQEANFTLNLSTPFTQTWGEWADFAPFGVNTGKYAFNSFFSATQYQTKIPVQERKDNTGLKQYKLEGWGAGLFTANGVTLIINRDANNKLTVPAVNTGASTSGFAVWTGDAYTLTGGQVPQGTYDPETGIFSMQMISFLPDYDFYNWGAEEETLTMDKPITERDTVYVTANMNISAEPTKGIIKVSAEFNDTTYILEVVGADTVGTFSLADGTLSKDYYYGIVSDAGRSDFAEGEVTITKDDEGYHLTGLMIGIDEKAYVFNWFMKVGVLEYDTDAPFDATFAYGDMSAIIEDGVISISATNADNQAISLELYTDPANTTIPAGTFVISDAYEAGTALKSVGVDGGYLTECWAGIRSTSGISDCRFLVEGTITLSYDEFGKLKVVVDGINSWGQPVTALIQYEKLDPKSTVEINADFDVIDDYIEQYGLMNFYGGNDNYQFDLYVYADTCVGNFIDAIDFGDCEIKSVAAGSSVGIIDAYAFNVVADGKNLTLTAQLLGSDTVQYNITATGYIGALEYDAKEAYNGEFAMEEVTLTQAETLVSIIGLNAAGDSINLVVEGELVGGMLPAGEYSNIVVSLGFYAYNFTPSFVLNEDAVWFIQSGKLTVAANGSMTFEGLNSYDKAVTITIGKQDPTALFNVNVNVNANKFLRKGRLIIRKGDKLYNAVGQKVK